MSGRATKRARRNTPTAASPKAASPNKNRTNKNSAKKYAPPQNSQPFIIPGVNATNPASYIPKHAPQHFGNRDSNKEYKKFRARGITNIRSSEWERKGYTLVKGDDINEGSKFLYVEHDGRIFDVEVIRVDTFPFNEQYFLNDFYVEINKYKKENKNLAAETKTIISEIEKYLSQMKYPLTKKLLFLLKREDGKDIFPVYNYMRGSVFGWDFYEKIVTPEKAPAPAPITRDPTSNKSP